MNIFSSKSHESKQSAANNSSLREMFNFLGVEGEYFSQVLGFEAESFNIFETDLPLCFWVHDESYAIVYGNWRFIEKHGNCTKKLCHKKIMGKEKVCGCCQSEEAFSCQEPRNCKICKRMNPGFDLNTYHWPVKNKHGKRFILKSSFHIDDSDAIYKDIFSEKQETRTNPILLISCSECKKVRDRNNNWVHIDKCVLDYFSERTSHGICPGCINLLYINLRISLDNPSGKKGIP